MPTTKCHVDGGEQSQFFRAASPLLTTNAKEGEKQMEDDGKKYNRKRRWRMRRMMGNVQEEKKS